MYAHIYIHIVCVHTHWYDGEGASQVLLHSEAATSIVKLTTVVRSTEHCHQLWQCIG